MKTIGIIENKLDVKEAISSYLRIEDMQAVGFESFADAKKAVQNGGIDMIVINIIPPSGDGFIFVKELRGHSDIPVIFLTAEDNESDRILGFEVGADDFVQKPFSLKEFVLRIKAILRRYDSERSEPAENYCQSWFSGDEQIEINFAAHKVFLNNDEVKFTTTEWKIVSYLTSNPQVVVSRDQILDHSLEYHFDGYDRIVDTHIKNIRAKLGRGRWIETVRGYGYCFSGNIEKQKHHTYSTSTPHKIDR